MKTATAKTRAGKLLIIDDDRFFCDSVRDDFADESFDISIANTVREAEAMCRAASFDVVLLDNNLPDGSGLPLIPEILRVNEHAKIILVTAFPNFENAVQALRGGAYDYVSKPVELAELRATIERAAQTTALEAVEEVSLYQAARERRETMLIGSGAHFAELQKLIARAAKSNASILITGETGTGKNVIAKAVHFQSALSDNAFISVNCAALPENLIEAELFGVEKGAFTGAHQTRKGTFELADGGTLFLDEIGEMPFALQAKLLSALEDRRIRRIGGGTERAVNVKVVAATNADPQRAIAENRFRRDLFYRLSVLQIHLAPLRERREDIPALCQYFLDQFAYGREISLPDDELRRLQNYDFPGNVRELRNIIERCVILQEGNFIRPSQIIGESRTPAAPFAAAAAAAAVDDSKILSLAEIEKNHILSVFGRLGNNIARTADALDVSLSTLKRKLREYGVR